MKNLAKPFAISLLSACAVYVLVGCTPRASVAEESKRLPTSDANGKKMIVIPNNQIPTKNPSEFKAEKKSLSPSNLSLGTTDSGGGTGVENKVFESYRIDPTKLSAYLKYVKPLLENIVSARGEDSTEYALIFKARTWRLVPMELEKVSKDALGVSFLKTATQQLARQSMSEVWINKKIFDQMNERDQADLLVHEMVMTLYFFRFQSLDQLCEATFLINGKKCGYIPEAFKQVMQPERKRPLDAQDNERIRVATDWLLANAERSISEIDFINVLSANKFDRRFFNPRNYLKKETQENRIKLSYKELADALRAGNLTGTSPKICSSANKSLKVSCDLKFLEAQFNYVGNLFPGIRVQVVSKEQTLADFGGFVGNEIELVENLDLEGKQYYTLTLLELKQNFQIGDRTKAAFVKLVPVNSVGQTQYIVETVTVNTSVITSIDQSRSTICQTMAPQLTKNLENSFIVHQNNKDALVHEQMLTATVLPAMCNPWNVNAR